MADKLGPSLTDIDVSRSKYHYLCVLLCLKVKMLPFDVAIKCVIVIVNFYISLFVHLLFCDDNYDICLQLSGKSPQTPHDVVEQGEVVCQEKLYHAVFDVLLVSFFSLIN